MTNLEAYLLLGITAFILIVALVIEASNPESDPAYKARMEMAEYFKRKSK